MQVAKSNLIKRLSAKRLRFCKISLMFHKRYPESAGRVERRLPIPSFKVADLRLKCAGWPAGSILVRLPTSPNLYPAHSRLEKQRGQLLEHVFVETSESRQ